MIVRVWHGWTSLENAPAFENLLRSTILPRIRQLPGCAGVQLLRRATGGEVEFLTLLFFDSLDSIRAWAGEPHDVAVVPPEARLLLRRFDERAAHYEAAHQA